MSQIYPWLGRVACAAVLVVAAWLILHDLGGPVLQLYDEGTYAQVMQESLERGDFLTFTLGGKVFFDKPPLYFWLAGCAAYFTDNPALMIRLPAALAGILLVAATMLLAYEWTRRYWAAALAGLLLILTQPFIQGAREARLDILVALFIMLAVYCFWRARANPRMYLFFGIAVGLAILSKSVIAVFALVAAISLASYLRDWEWLRHKYLWLGALAGLVVAAPWHLYETYVWGLPFWQSYLGEHVLHRFGENIFYDPALQTNYTVHVFRFAPVITLTFLLALALVPRYWHRLARSERAALVVCLSTAAAMLLVFYTAQTRAFSYLLPVYPFAALTVSLAVHGLFKNIIVEK